MRVAEYIDKLNPYEQAKELHDLYNEKCEAQSIKTIYGDYENSKERYKKSVQDIWEKARKSQTFEDDFVGLFVCLINKYKEILKADCERKLIEAEYKEKLVEYEYGGIIDEKYWEGEHLLFIAEYLENGKAKNIKQAVRLYEKDGGQY